MDSVRTFLHDWRLVLLVIHVAVTATMIIVILLQRSEGGGLGMGARTDALFSVRGQTNVLSRTTGICAGIFFFLSLVMAWSVSEPVRTTRSIMDNLPATPEAGGAAPAAPGTPAAPAQPSAPTR